MKHQNWTDDEIAHALKGSDAQRDAAWHHICGHTDWRLSTLRFVTKFGGDATDAQDVFREAALIFDQKIRANERTGEGALKTFFIGIARNKWLKLVETRHRRQKHEIIVENPHLQEHPRTASPEDDQLDKERRENLWKMLAQVGERCLKILKLDALGHSMTEIANELNLAGGADAAKKEKYRCLQRTLRFLVENPDWKNRII